MGWLDWLLRRKPRKPVRPPVQPPPVQPPPTPPPVPIVVDPVPAAQQLIEVVSVFENWEKHCRYYIDGQPIVTGTEAPFEHPWEALKTPNREPAIGYYDEADPLTTQFYLDSIQKGGFDVACYQVGWSHQHAVNYPYGPPYKIHPLLYDWGPRNHPPESPTRFFLSNWDAPAGVDPAHFVALRGERGWGDGEMELSHFMFGQACGEFMKHPRYFHINDRPVLMRGWAHTLAFYQQQHGFNLSPQAIIQLWRAGVRNVTGKNPYIVATSMEHTARPFVAAWGFDALTEYLLHGKGYPAAMERYRVEWDETIKLCRQLGIDYLVPATGGYDGEAWQTDPWAGGWTSIPTADQYEAHSREARQVALADYDITHGIVIHYALTEHGEGGIILPLKPGMLHDGDEMARAHRAALT